MRGTYVHLPATSREVEEERHLQLTEGFQVLTKPFSRELLQGILVALGGFLHFTFLVGAQDGKTVSVCWAAEEVCSRSRPSSTVTTQGSPSPTPPQWCKDKVPSFPLEARLARKAW